MKKITLILALSLNSLVSFAQQPVEEQPGPTNVERESMYIIVLDDEVVDGNIYTLLNGSDLKQKINTDLQVHELAHDAYVQVDIQSKFVESAFSYNEYALHDSRVPSTGDRARL